MRSTFSTHHHYKTVLSPIEEAVSTQYSCPKVIRNQAWLILESVLNQSRASIITQQKIALSDTQSQTLDHIISTIRDQGMPIPYAVGHTHFLDLTIQVRPPILLPRVETEAWCAWLIQKLVTEEPTLTQKSFTILDIGTGSGCIALAFATAFKQALVTGIDCNQNALELAQINAHTNTITTTNFINSDLYNNLPTGANYSLILANPPYIAPHEYITLDKSVRDWEDYKALVSQNNGLAALEAIITQAPNYLTTGHSEQTTLRPQLWCEIGGAHQVTSVTSFFNKAGFKDITCYNDDNSIPRLLGAYLR